jgi:hypothetical protein
LTPVLLLAAMGCGAADWGFVVGKVSLDGRRLEKGIVTFIPLEGGAPGIGQVSQGSFTVQTGARPGLKVGRYAVTVMEANVPKPGEQIKVLTPSKYADVATTEFKFEVKAGANEVTLEMKAK